ncbi:MAG: CPBP family intramembrane glutamic endopeptidase [Nocardioidaceae bacterium]
MVNARRCFALGVAVLVVFNLARSFGLLGPPVVSSSVLTAAMIVVAWASGATRGDLGLGRADVGPGVRYGVAAFGVVLLVLLVAAALPWTNAFLHDSRAAISGPRLVFRLLVSITLLTAIPEELAFRGVLLGSALHLWRPWRASVVTSVLFGLWHIAPTLRTMRDNAAVSSASTTLLGQGAVVLGAVGATFAAGVAFCWLRLRSRSLVAPILAHIATNGLALAVAWVAVH